MLIKTIELLKAGEATHQQAQDMATSEQDSTSIVQAVKMNS